MHFSIPLFIETRRPQEGGPARHHVRPLFFPEPVRFDEDLSRAQQRLVGDLQQHLLQLGRNPHHAWLAAWTFAPTIEQHRLDLLLELRRRTARGRFFFVAFQSLGRKLAFCPNLPNVWFEVTRGQTLAHRATESLSQYFRKQEQEADDEANVRPEDYAMDGTAWTTTVDIELDIVQSFRDPAQQLMALLGAADVSNGAIELRNCGRCLNWQYPSGLDRAFLRNHEVSELERRMLSPDRRPVLLLGRRLSGKTAIIHEYVARVTSRRQSPYASRTNVWLLSPQRLISGMSVVGQWESRLLAILKEARKRNHILYFDDLPGLLQAGKSRDSSLSMGQVIRPYLERREIRLLAEITPEAWRILRERDRGLSDLFEVLPVSETDPETTARIVLASRRQMEQQFRCQFELESLPAVLEIERRYSPDAAFPGKAVRFLKDLALIRRDAEVTRDCVLDEFHRRSGLVSQFLDPRQKLTRREIVNSLSQEVVGQPQAVAAVSDLLTIAKARLNDTGRPIGSLLFVGPTGVGKTQLAKAAAKFLFGDSNRLLRFDLNEYVNRGSATRLVGTFDEPDGLLTGAVRRQPFAVILLDEIEKGHPEVVDVLLQVLGEGRLSDGLGRTVSFSNTLIIMTSNLGVRENSQRVGFAGDAPVGDHVWVKAVQQFFRPEFFNRIDRIVPFHQLSREVIEQVARIVLNEMLTRDGLARRRCVLSIEPQALDHAISAGYTPTLGARALKRSLEQLLIQPAGRQLAALQIKTLTRLHLYPSPDGIAVNVQPLEDAAAPANCVAVAPRRSASELVGQISQFIARVEAEIAQFRPDGPVSAGDFTDQHQAYYLIQERCRQFKDVLRSWADLQEAASQPGALAPLPNVVFRHAKKVVSHRPDTPSSFWAGLAREESNMVSFHQSLRDLFDNAEIVQGAESDLLMSLLHQVALTNVELTAIQKTLPTRIGLCIRPLDGHDGVTARELAVRLQRILSSPVKEMEIDLGLECSVVADTRLSGGEHANETLLEISGLAAFAIVHSETGIHLDYSVDGRFRAIQVIPVPLLDGESVADGWSRLWRARIDWIRQLAAGTSHLDDDPLPPGNVVRVYEGWGLTLDLRTGNMTEGNPDAQAWRRFLLGAFPLPTEIHS